MKRELHHCLLFIFSFCIGFNTVVAADQSTNKFNQQISSLTKQHPNQSGAYVLEQGEQSLMLRAWLADEAQHSIEVQYFIWSSDNIGTLAAEALLRAADRGVNVRVIVDDLLIDAGNESLSALAVQPNVQIKIYNPKHVVGVSFWRRLVNIVSDFRAANQRMHNKTFIVDGQIAITGGRNMSDEYYDYDHEYNFRDRDVLLLGAVVANMRQSFEQFWQSPLSVPATALLRDEQHLSSQEITAFYQELHAYADNPENFAPEVRSALADMSIKVGSTIDDLVWGDFHFFSDEPGKNAGNAGLVGGGITTQALINAVKHAKQRITIQSPYLVLPEGGLELFSDLIQKGVEVRISTNSLASTDNLLAFSGYARQRDDLLKAGIKVYEYKPHPDIQKTLMQRYDHLKHKYPIFAVHAKTMVLDGETVFIGTFNLDPRSANLNTEVGVLIPNKQLARRVEKYIENDMLPVNSWRADTDDPNQYAAWTKRFKLFFLKPLPLEPLL